MPKLPSRLPESGANAGLYHWLNQILDYCKSLTPRESLHTLTSHSALGVHRQGTAKGTTTEGGEDPARWV